MYMYIGVMCEIDSSLDYYCFLFFLCRCDIILSVGRVKHQWSGSSTYTLFHSKEKIQEEATTETLWSRPLD